jgi:hypothetical protein
MLTWRCNAVDQLLLEEPFQQGRCGKIAEHPEAEEQSAQPQGNAPDAPALELRPM